MQQRSVRFNSTDGVISEGKPVPASDLQAVVNPMSAERDAGEWKRERQRQRTASRDVAATADSDEENPLGFEQYMAVEELQLDALLLDTGGSGDDDDDHDEQDLHGLDDGTASRASTHQTQMDDTRRQLEDLQIRTIFSLVEPVQVDQDKKHLLFLSNRQASKFDFSAMPKVLSALDIPAPKLVINLFMSMPYTAIKSTFHGCCRQYTEAGSTVATHHDHAELDVESLENTDLRIATFLQECVLPVAIQTQAVVITHISDCAFSAAWSRICKAYAATVNGKLPFSVVNFTTAGWLQTASNTEGTMAYAMKRGSKRWQDAAAKVHDSMLPERVDACFCDLPAGSTHYVVLDGITRGEQELWGESLQRFQNQFIQNLCLALPSIAIQTVNRDIDGLASQCADYVARGLPLLLLDSRPPCEMAGGSNDVDAAANNFFGSPSSSSSSSSTAGTALENAPALLEVLDERLARAGTVNEFHASTLAFLHMLMEEQAATRTRTTGVDLDGDGSPDLRLIADVLDESGPAAAVPTAVASRGRHGGGAAAAGGSKRKSSVWSPDIDTSEEARAREVKRSANRALRIFEATLTRQAETLRRWDLASTLRSLRALRVAQPTVAALDAWLEEAAVLWRYHHSVRHSARVEELMARFGRRAGGLLRRKRGMKDGALLMFVPCVFVPEAGEDGGQGEGDGEGKEGPEAQRGSAAALAAFKGEMITLLEGWAQELREASSRVSLGADKKMALCNLLTSAKLYSGNLSEPRRLQRKIAEIAKIDRLPKANTREAMHILRQAWDAVDIFTHVSLKSKAVAKVSYALILLTGIAIAAVTVVSLNAPELLNAEQLSRVVLGLSLFGSVVAAVTTYLNPAQRWLQLRGAALALEAEIWK